ncbi:MAG: hypothetical protein FJZ89_09510 [Chloroflexi bacterium]|nr:hypothetical protein [Chloroflexota bacterium]
MNLHSVTTAPPGQEEALPGLVRELVHRFSDLWWACDTGLPALGPAYSSREQAAREAQLAHLQDVLIAELQRPPQTRTEVQATQERIFAAIATFARSALDLEQRHLDVLFARGFPQAATEFAQAARRFDPQISGSEIFQASRNAWVMNGLQLLLGLPLRLTPAIFAYSLLYPYSDNYLDDPAIAEETKLAFNERFGRRLRGEAVTPTNAHEQRIFDLVGMVEGQYAPVQHPQVFASLLAIHRAQIKSVHLLRRCASPYEVDVLGISFEKGGTSVLADGYLVAGTLTPAQAEFLFGWGAFAQLLDDLQDVEQDGRDGLLTVFSRTARPWHSTGVRAVFSRMTTPWPLDAITNRTFHFSARVMELVDCFTAPGSEPLKELMRMAAVLPLINAAGRSGRCYTAGYLRELEAHSPFRFSFLRQSSQKLAHHRVSLMRMVEAFATIGDAPAG